MSISEKFRAFVSAIRISDDSIQSIRSRYHRITSRINVDFWNIESCTAHSLYVGSYGRDTDIVVSDIDVVVILPSNLFHQYDQYTGNGQSALLQAVKNSLCKTYNTSHLRADGQVICINFTDGIQFEIVPCFDHKDGHSFIYPDTRNGGSWKVTDPRSEINAIREMNKQCNNNLKPLCRMIRSWKYKNCVPIGGLLIDTLAYRFLQTWGYSDKSYTYYDWMTRDFFHFLSERNPHQDYWLAPGSNQRVYRNGNFEYKEKLSYNNAIKALEHENNNADWSANQKWREIYGSKFPS